MILSDNGISKVELRSDGYVYKTQPKFNTDNEIYCLKLLYPSGYVPQAWQIDIETIRMKYILPQPVVYFDLLCYHFIRALKALGATGIRHGDLTIKNIIVNRSKPYLIDFSESRLACDPRPDKRRESDFYWLQETFKRLQEIGQKDEITTNSQSTQS